MSKTNQKYEILSDDVWRSSFGGHLGYRIRATRDFGSVCKGDLGGYIGSSTNLSQDGLAWVAGEALVTNSARVYEDAWVGDNAYIDGSAHVKGRAVVIGKARVVDTANIYGDAVVYGDTHISYRVSVCGTAKVGGDAEVAGTALVDSGHLTCGFWFSSRIGGERLTPKHSLPQP